MKEIIKKRHSVRSYIDKPINQNEINILNEEIEKINQKHQLNFQLIVNDSKTFKTMLARYGLFKGVTNYFVLVADKNTDEEIIGYYGEYLVLLSQKLGLNTCWVGLTYKKNKCQAKVKENEKIFCVIALGYGEYQGKPHKNKPIDKVMEAVNPPSWFIEGVEAAMLAPTAINQQKFKFIYSNEQVIAQCFKGPYSKIDLGIVKYHFEIGAQKDHSIWKS